MRGEADAGIVEVENGVDVLEKDVADDPLVGAICLVANNHAVAHVVGGIGHSPHVVLGRNDVLDAREGDENIGRGVTGDNVGFAVVGGSGDQVVQGGGVGWGSQPVRRAGVDHGGFGLESDALVVHARIVQGDFPAEVTNGLGVTELAFEFGIVDSAECDLPVFDAVRGSMEVHANDLVF